MKTTKKLTLNNKGKVVDRYVGVCYMGQLQYGQMFSFINKDGIIEKEKYFMNSIRFGIIQVAQPGMSTIATFVKYDPKKLVYKYSSMDFRKIMGWI